MHEDISHEFDRVMNYQMPKSKLPSAGPGAPTTAAPDTNPFHHFIAWLGSLFGSPGSQQAQAKQLSQGGAYLANGGRQRTQGVNDVIDQAAK